MAATSAAGLLLFSACERDSELEDAAEEAGDAVEEAAEEISDE